MPKAKTKSKHNHPDKLNSSFAIALDTFRENGHFILTNGILTTELLVYLKECLKNRPKPSSEKPYKFCLNNVTFKLEVPVLSPQETIQDEVDTILWQLHQIFHFSPEWCAIAFDNVTILHGENRYPLSSYFIYRFMSIITDKEAERDKGDVKLRDYLTDLSITKAEFHSWAWMRFLTSKPKLDSLTLEWLPNEDQEDNIMVLCEALYYAKIKVLNLGDTEISVEGYQALYEILAKNYFIEKMIVKEPTDPASLALFKKIKERLPAGRTGKQRFDIERFNQAEFLRLFLRAKNALQHETDQNEIYRLEKEIKFILEEKYSFSIITTDEEENWDQFKRIPSAHMVYSNHAEYILGRLPLFRLDLNQFVDNETRTLGHYLLEDALERNDTFMVNCLIAKGSANLLEQQGDEKPILMQIFEKNRDFKLLILNRIFYDKTIVSMAERVLYHYPKSKEIMVDMGYSLTNYAETLYKRACPYLLSDSVRLLNLLKDIAQLSRPSKQRDQEFIEIYWRVGKCLILFHNAGRVTVESISNAQSTLGEIRAISWNAEWGWKQGSKLHRGLINWLDSLKKDMDWNKQLMEKDNVIDEKDKVIAQKDKTIKNLNEECEYLKAKIQQNQENAEAERQQMRENAEVERQQFRTTIAAMQAQLESAKGFEGPSTGFFRR
jgi:hypothetical protein